MNRTAFKAAMEIYRMLPHQVCMYIGFEAPVKEFEKIIQAAIDSAASDPQDEPAPARAEAKP